MGTGFAAGPRPCTCRRAGTTSLIVDNLSRRNIDNELEVESLTPIRPMGERLRAWAETAGRAIPFHRFDVAQNYHRLLTLLREVAPDAVVHFAEQRAAPYSMKSPLQKRYTVDNNINATHNVLCAIVESGLDIHLVHLGTMGVYGYGTAGIKIPEGYLQVRIDADDGRTVEQEILYPANPGSIYHMTKTLDQLLFAYYNKNDRVKITDLHQGIVWGTQTEETRADVRLINRFDYDGDYGTVLNRFLMQAAVGYPLTVHGTGGQTRAFIHIQDTVRCIELAVAEPAAVRRPGQHPEPDDRDPPRARPRPDRGRGDGGHHRPGRQPTRRGRRERPVRREPAPAQSGPRPDHALRGSPARGRRDRPDLRGPRRSRQDPLPLTLASDRASLSGQIHPIVSAVRAGGRGPRPARFGNAILGYPA